MKVRRLVVASDGVPYLQIGDGRIPWHVVEKKQKEGKEIEKRRNGKRGREGKFKEISLRLTDLPIYTFAFLYLMFLRLSVHQIL